MLKGAHSLANKKPLQSNGWLNRNLQKQTCGMQAQIRFENAY